MKITKFIIISLILVVFFIAVIGWIVFYLPQYSHHGEHPGIKWPGRPTAGPGGSDCQFHKIKALSFGQGENKSWIFFPSRANLNHLPVILLIHGWSATYLKSPEYRPDEVFITHLVQEGNIVIYPVYLRGFLNPLPTKYVGNVIALTEKSLLRIKQLAPKNNLSKFAIIGYSIGGSLATYLPNAQGVPGPKAIILVEPTEGVPFHIPIFNIPFASLNNVFPDTLLTVLFGSDDKIVPLKETLQEIDYVSRKLVNRYFFEIQSDFHGDPPLVANHFGFLGSYTNKLFPVNTIDYEYQKIIDATLDCAFFQRYCNIIKGNDSQFFQSGTWSDGRPVKPIKKINLNKEP